MSNVDLTYVVSMYFGIVGIIAHIYARKEAQWLAPAKKN